MRWGEAYVAEDSHAVDEAKQMKVGDGSDALILVDAAAADAQRAGDGLQLLAFADDFSVLDWEALASLLEDGGGTAGEAMGKSDEEVLDWEAWLCVFLHAGAILVDAAVEDLGDVAGFRAEWKALFVVFGSDQHDGGVGRGFDDIGADHFHSGVRGLKGGDANLAIFVAAEDAGDEVGAEAARVAPLGGLRVFGL